MLAVGFSLTTTITPTNIWLIGVSFVLFQFFLQLSSGLFLGAIMHDLQLSAFETGVLSSAFYYIYTSLQIPVGLLFDRKNTQFLLWSSALVCSLGCFFFAASHQLLFLIVSRLLMGAGSAFAFVGLSHLLRQHFPLGKFAFMIGLSETLGFLVTMLAMIGVGILINQWGWRNFINGAGLIGLVISYLCWRFLPTDFPQMSVPTNYAQQLLQILKNKKAWINGLFVGLSFAVITVFAALWAVPFIQQKLTCSLPQASLIDAMVFLGAAISCPLFGYLANCLKRRKPLMIASCLTTAMLLLMVLYLPIHGRCLMALLMFLIGLSCGAYMLAFSIANELAPANLLSTCSGFTNTLAMLTAPVLQPLVGYFLDRSHNPWEGYRLHDYQNALLIIPLVLIVASALVFLLPEKKDPVI